MSKRDVDEELEDLGAIPSSVLNDEILYKRYMAAQVRSIFKWKRNYS